MRSVDRVGGVLVETYRIERLIAEGSMGSVYEARHVRIPKRFAVKFLRIGLQDNPEALERFRREAEVVAGLDHQNVVEIYDYNVGDDGFPYIVLEYLDGESLATRLGRDGRIGLDETLRIARAVAAGLTVAHARDVIHRDLKPENIVLCADGGVKVVDFGVAKLRGAPELTAVNKILGTVPYMAPEQLMGGVLDARVDQYALAAIAYEMLAGEMAFDGSGSVTDVARRILTHVPPFVAGVPQAVNEVLFRGMARAAGDRFDSVADFERALVDAAAAPREPALAEPSGELPPLAGEATRVTMPSLSAAERAAADAEDPPAPPPEDRAPSKEPRTPTLQSPTPILGGPTHEMPTVLGGPTNEMPVASADEPTERPPLPGLSTMVVQSISAGNGQSPRVAEPRVTLKTMSAATAPSGWDAVRDDRTHQIRPPSRWLWVALGMAVGIVAALITVYALRR
jgi:serine/threonine protein kinase